MSVANKDSEKLIRRERFRAGLGNVGKALAGVGLPMLGHAVAGPAGGAIASRITSALGLHPEAEPDQIEASIAASDPEALVELRRLEVQLTQAENAVMIAEEEADSSRIESVNKTMVAEVLANPEAGAWRPLWGRWSCYGFWGITGLLTLAFVWSVVGGKDASLISVFPEMFQAVSWLMSVPLVILGVASWHRGKEKRIMAGEATAPLLSLFNRHQNKDPDTTNY